MAGAGTSIPITVISHAPYTVDAVVHLAATGITFPKGSAVAISMSSPTQSIRVPTADPHGSSLTLQVVLTTPNDQVVLARSAIQVRIAGTSVVGYLLTFASLLVLGAVVVAHQSTSPTRTPRPMSVASSHSSRVVSMASGTLVSRVTGLFRVLVLAWVLGFTPIADAFNLANTVPNMLFDLVLGGIATATFIPVFVERLALDGERRAWKSISNIVTGAVVILVVASVASWFLAPYIIDGFTFLQRTSSTHSGVGPRATETAGQSSSVRSRPICCASSCRRSFSTASSVLRQRCSTFVVASVSPPGCPSLTTWCASACSSGFTWSTPTPCSAR